jgi:serine phosphatase RsbU (regulator of sigma subunit)
MSDSATQAPTGADALRQWECVRRALSRLIGAPPILDPPAAGAPADGGTSEVPVSCFSRPFARLSAPGSDPARLAAAAQLLGLVAEREATIANLLSHVARLWRELNFMLAAERRLALPLDVPTAARTLLEPVLQTLGAERGSIYVAEASALTPLAVRGVPESHLAPIAVDDPDSIAAWVYRHGAPLVLNDAARRPPALRAHQFPLSPGSRDAFLALPLLLPDAERSPVGVLNLAGKRGGHFTSDDVKVATAVAQMVAVAIHRSRQTAEAIAAARLREELRLAADIHSGLLPGAPPTLPGLEIATGMRPAGAVSGDYFDFVTGDGCVDLLMADVQGHGLGAALLVGTVRVVLRSALREGLEPTRALDRLNQTFIDTGREEGIFATAAIARLRGERVTYASAGHPPLLLAGDGRPRVLTGGGPPAGVLPEARYDEREDRIGTGGVIALYTDGLLGRGGQGAVDRLLDALDKAAGLGLARIIESLMDGADGAADDRTLLVVRRR